MRAACETSSLHCRCADEGYEEGGERSGHMILFTSSSHPLHGVAVAAIDEASHSYKGDLINVVVDLSKTEVTASIAEAFGITTAQIPCLRVLNLDHDIKFDFQELEPRRTFEPTVDYVEDVAMAYLAQLRRPPLKD
eukprot:COSAG01_NODE_3333_length_6238_cov_5.009448_6_plen_136_part_00